MSHLESPGLDARQNVTATGSRARIRLTVAMGALAVGLLGVTNAVAGQELRPHLEQRGPVTQLIVDGQPFLALAGELRNNSATSLEYMEPIWPRMVELNLNTVLAAVSWAQFEPVEGQFDYRLVDGLVEGARAHGLRLVLLWFGSWKNTWSSYTPEWVKRDFDRFPRVQLKDGSGTERLSPFSEANRDADARAFAALMRRIREIDSERHTVIMVQVQNEVGVIPDARDPGTPAGG